MGIGTQENGLPVECKFDTIGMHDFSDASTWKTPVGSSSWILDPTDAESPFHNKVIKLNEIQLDFAELIKIHVDGELLIEFYMTGNSNPVKTISYKSMSDWISRSHTKQRVDYKAASVGPFMQYNIAFAEPPTLWTSTGVDTLGDPKLNKMVVRIADNEPYKDEEGEPGKLARGRYFAEIYDDPDI